MSQFLQNLEWWHWMVLAVLLAAAETLIPGAVAIWFAASAARHRPADGRHPIFPGNTSSSASRVLGIAAMLLYRAYRKKNPETSSSRT